MDCQKAQEEIFMSDDPAATAALPEIAAHAGGCALCQGAVAQLVRLESATKTLPVSGPADRVPMLVLERLTGIKAKSSNGCLRRVIRGAVAAAIVITFGLIALTMLTSTKPAQASAVFRDLVEWNLQIAKADPAKREQVYQGRLADMEKEAKSLPDQERAVALRLLGKAAVLAKMPNAVSDTQQFVEMADCLQEMQQKSKDKAAAAEFGLIYNDVVKNGIEASLNRVDVQAIPAAGRQAYENLQKDAQRHLPATSPAPIGPGALLLPTGIPGWVMPESGSIIVNHPSQIPAGGITLPGAGSELPYGPHGWTSYGPTMITRVPSKAATPTSPAGSTSSPTSPAQPATQPASGAESPAAPPDGSHTTPPSEGSVATNDGPSDGNDPTNPPATPSLPPITQPVAGTPGHRWGHGSGDCEADESEIEWDQDAIDEWRRKHPDWDMPNGWHHRPSGDGWIDPDELVYPGSFPVTLPLPGDAAGDPALALQPSYGDISSAPPAASPGMGVGDGSTLVLGGAAQSVPEPAAAFILLLGAPLLLRRRRPA